MKTIVVCALFFLSLIHAVAFATDLILMFDAPTTNNDGIPVEHLDKGNGKADFKIYQGIDNGGPYENVIPVEGYAVGTSMYRLTGLTQGKHCFVVTAVSTFGMESDYSNEACKVLLPDTGTLQLLSPNGGEMLSAGSYHVIYWQDPTGASKYRLKYSMDNGVTREALTAGFLTDTCYDWLVPTPTTIKRTCLVKVIGYDENSVKLEADISDAPFTIGVAATTGLTTIIAPAPDEHVTAGTPAYPIRWSADTENGVIASSAVSYTLNGGLTWKTIGSTSGNPGTFLWDVPAVERIKTKCRIKLLLRDASGRVIAKAFSNYFTVKP